MLHGEVSEEGHLACNGEKNAWALVWFTVKTIKVEQSEGSRRPTLPGALTKARYAGTGFTCEKGLKN